ncbi:uncharacterized protein LOC142986619 [Anticarsia gemmatalis]|uniref:uncharacterized protein LOC142972634 n=1 Tax=Anticarsia gemmatalis TaxID=129554 RepID=UPI003F76C0A7
MSQKVLKFGSADLIKFIEIYRSHDCLWDTENLNYKNRDARNAALAAFAQEFGVEGFGPKEITNKIKNLRTQYHGERKKIKDSMGTGSGTADVFISKLSWYNLMDSFLKKSSEHRQTTSNMVSNTSQDDIVFEYIDNTENNPNIPNSDVQVLHAPSPMPKKTTKKTSGYIESALNKLDNIEKRARLEKTDDDLDNFGKYVASSLRILNTENSIHAQDEIQAVLSKFKLLDHKEKERKNSTPMPESPYSKQGSEDTWWNS